MSISKRNREKTGGIWFLYLHKDGLGEVKWSRKRGIKDYVVMKVEVRTGIFAGYQWERGKRHAHVIKQGLYNKLVWIEKNRVNARYVLFHEIEGTLAKWVIESGV
jgi:hypothetical protein